MTQTVSSSIEYLSPPSSCMMADEWYDHASADHFWMKWRFDVVCKLLPRRLDLGEVLEVGCGSCVALKQIEDYYNCPVHGCDLNAEALRKAKPGRGHLYCYDINQRNAELKNRFSTIFLLDVLEHIGDEKQFLESINYHLGDAGRLILSVPAHSVLYSKYDSVDGHFRRYSISELDDVLRKSGFTLEMGTYWGMSLLPVIVLRKFFLLFIKRRNVIKIGFQPQHFVVERILQALRRFECSLFSKVPFGSSIVVVARKIRTTEKETE